MRASIFQKTFFLCVIFLLLRGHVKAIQYDSRASLEQISQMLLTQQFYSDLDEIFGFVSSEKHQFKVIDKITSLDLIKEREFVVTIENYLKKISSPVQVLQDLYLFLKLKNSIFYDPFKKFDFPLIQFLRKVLDHSPALYKICQESLTDRTPLQLSHFLLNSLFIKPMHNKKYDQKELSFFKKYDQSELKTMFHRENLRISTFNRNHIHISTFKNDKKNSLRVSVLKMPDSLVDTPSFHALPPSITPSLPCLLMDVESSLWLVHALFRKNQSLNLSQICLYSLLQIFQQYEEDSFPSWIIMKKMRNDPFDKYIEHNQEILEKEITDVHEIRKICQAVPHFEIIVRISKFFKIEIESFSITTPLDAKGKFDIIMKLKHNDQGDPNLLFFEIKDTVKLFLQNPDKKTTRELIKIINHIIQSQNKMENLVEFESIFLKYSSFDSLENISFLLGTLFREEPLLRKALEEIYDKLEASPLKKSFGSICLFSPQKYLFVKKPFYCFPQMTSATQELCFLNNRNSSLKKSFVQKHLVGYSFISSRQLRFLFPRKRISFPLLLARGLSFCKHPNFLFPEVRKNFCKILPIGYLSYIEKSA